MKVLLLMVLASSMVFADEIVFIPVQDAYVCDCQPGVTNPNGGPAHLYYGRYGSCYDRSLIQWDLSSIPAGTQIESAEMRMYCMSFTGSPSGQPVFYLVNEAWDELTVTFDTQPSYGPEPVLSGSWPQPSTWFSIDVTPFVQAWIDGSRDNFGIYCTSIGTTGTSVPGFWSKDGDQEELRPQLVVTFTSDLSSATWGEAKVCGCGGG